ncbi:MAG TPA: bifunctional hydroxymethylpyrimidine kinase/phosphomethylpyrimidine kinase, partial [Enterococcus sp.]|nr:bifunctional hydroxymethylpyrimidine kinase/phosphomethylpyrimidine kinase [Enterococcus sp.]
MAKITLTIGGSDTWGGGGIQTDLKTFENLQTFGLSVLTCIAVAENDDFVIRPLPASLIHEQLQTIEQTFQLDGVKIGLLASAEIVDLVIDFCQRNRGKFPIILDPVLAFKETEQQLQQDYLQKIRELAQWVDLITPNLK